MGKTKVLGILCCFFFVSISSASEIVHSSGVVELYGAGGKPHAKTGALQSRMRAVTQNGWLLLKLRPELRVWVLENTEIEFINSQLVLSAGRIFVSCKDSCDLNFSTPISSDLLSEGEYSLEYFPKVPKLTVAVKKGSFRLRGLGNDKALVLNENQSADFEGRFEFGEIAYDILLQGKKAARGLLSAVRDLTSTERKLFEMPRVPVVKTPRATQQNISEYICAKPRGKLNQCLWECKGHGKNEKSCVVGKHSCQRSRCNANGKWAEQTLLEPTRWKCKTTQALIAECDY